MKPRVPSIVWGVGGVALLYWLCKQGKLPLQICRFLPDPRSAGLRPWFATPGQGFTFVTEDPGDTGDPGSGSGTQTNTGTNPSGSGAGSGTVGWCGDAIPVPFSAHWTHGSKQAFLGTVHFTGKTATGAYKGEVQPPSTWAGYPVVAEHSVLCKLLNSGKVIYLG